MNQRLWKPETVSVWEAEAFLRDLRQWSQALPTHLRRLSNGIGDTPGVMDRERTVGAVHVSCVYYFSVILVTRPFLTSHVMLKLREQRNGLPSAGNGKNRHPDATERFKIAELADVCVDSAIYMSTMAHKAMEAGTLLKNMVLLKYVLSIVSLLQ